MALTRFGYLVILLIIAAAAAAVAFVLWPGGGSNDSAARPVATVSAVASAPDANANPTIALYPNIEFARVVDFIRLGAVSDIEITGGKVLVNFRPDFDTSGFGTTSHTFQGTMADGLTPEQVLQDAGIPVNQSGGVTVVRR